MGWGNIGLSWARYAKGNPTTNCERCHLDYLEEADSCPHCGTIEDDQLQHFLTELEKKKQRNNKLFIIFIAALLFYAVFVLVVLPMYIR